MNSQVIKTKDTWDLWIRERRKHDIDFDGDTFHGPCLVVWADTESNGYPYVEYTVFWQDCIARINSEIGVMNA